MSDPETVGLIAPLVNINGTSKAALIEAHVDATHAIRAAMKALGETRPNARDFQTAPKGHYETSRAQYEARFAALDRIANELQDLAENIDQQGG